MIHTKSAEEEPSKRDGLRLYVTRFWPRGHRRAECDEWLPNLAPSEKLLRQFQAEEVSWREFEREYKKEMLQGLGDESARNPRQKNSGQKYVIRLLKKLSETTPITLICSCPPDAEHCHRHVLKKLVEA
ncbi:MAG TPA: DUF488 family protein [Prosthecobacter sp.]